MANILPENETTTFEDQVYVNPETSLNEQTAFIDALRVNQQQQNQEIQQQTHDLGTDVPSNLGGLTGGEGYFTSRYQTPQTNSLVADLRATAQAQALSQALQNQQSMWQKRYNDAYNAAQKRAAARVSGDTTSTSTTEPLGADTNPGSQYEFSVDEANANNSVAEYDTWTDPSTGQTFNLLPFKDNWYNAFLQGEYNELNPLVDGAEKSAGNKRFRYFADRNSWFELQPQ